MIYYVCYYTHPKISEERRIAAPAAVNKVGYVLKALEEACDESIEVVVLSETREKRCFLGKKISLSERVVLKTFVTLGGNKLMRMVGYFLNRMARFVYLMTHVKRGDYIVSYHSPSSMRLVYLIRKLKSCHLMIEVEELYANVSSNSALRRKELAYLDKADSYIFITRLLEQKLNSSQKPYAISHGTYHSIPVLARPLNDGKIHVIYAGTLRQVKGGAYDAIKAAAYLDEKFVLDIMGGGTPEEIKEIIALIDKISSGTKCQIRYVGFFTGDSFNAAVQQYDIGLSTQNMNGKFVDTSFPSKILMYMSNGLKVVSPRIPAIETSNVGEYVFYYDSPEPEAIAEAIRVAAKEGREDSRLLLETLNYSFVKELSYIIH